MVSYSCYLMLSLMMSLVRHIETASGAQLQPYFKLKPCDVGEYADFGESVQLVERVFDDWMVLLQNVREKMEGAKLGSSPFFAPSNSPIATTCLSPKSGLPLQISGISDSGIQSDAFVREGRNKVVVRNC